MAIIASKKPVWITLSAALLVHALLISFQANHRIDTSFVRGAILDVLAPLEKLVDRSVHGTGSIWDRYFALIGVRDENVRLRSEVDDLKMQISKEHEEIQEAQRVRNLAGLSEAVVGKTVVARVIGRDPTQNHQSVTIDKGRADGIQPDAAVITPEGVVGRVIYSGNYSAIVQLILDSQSGVGVLFLPKRTLGIIKGTGGSELDLEYIEDDTDIQEGAQLITSGQDRIYPKGLPVGVIASIGPKRGLFKAMRIRPAVNMGRLEEVLCVVERPRPAETVDPMDRPPAP